MKQRPRIYSLDSQRNKLYAPLLADLMAAADQIRCHCNDFTALRSKLFRGDRSNPTEAKCSGLVVTQRRWEPNVMRVDGLRSLFRTLLASTKLRFKAMECRGMSRRP